MFTKLTIKRYCHATIFKYNKVFTQLQPAFWHLMYDHTLCTTVYQCFLFFECSKCIFYLSTGDIAYYDTDGYFYIVDRIKELIKCKGLQVIIL